MAEILLEEIRQNRKEIQSLKKDIWILKSRFMMIAVTMGLAGGKLSTILPFLK